MSTAPLNVVVVGGGYGATAARALSIKLDKQKYNLILVDARPYAIHMPATARLSVTEEGNLENHAMLPYDRVFSKGHGTHKQGRAVAIEKAAGQAGGSVVLQSGERIPFHVLLLSTGSTWAGPIHFSDDADANTRHIASTRAAFKAANSIAIVGGGAVGVELSGELKDAYPNKKITIIHRQPSLLNSTYPDRFRRAVEAGVTRRGIQLVLDDSVDAEIPGLGPVNGLTTRKGAKIEADLVVAARGPSPNTDFVISSLGGDVARPNGHLKTRTTLQLESHPDIFALGDITDFPEQTSAAKAAAHVGIAVANIVAYTKNPKATLTQYKGSPEVLALTNGKNGGQTWLGFLWGIHLGDWLTSLIKSRGLLVGMFKGGIGY